VEIFDTKISDKKSKKQLCLIKISKYSDRNLNIQEKFIKDKKKIPVIPR